MKRPPSDSGELEAKWEIAWPERTNVLRWADVELPHGEWVPVTEAQAAALEPVPGIAIRRKKAD